LAEKFLIKNYEECIEEIFEKNIDDAILWVKKK
jgi:hypothetical protein